MSFQNFGTPKYPESRTYAGHNGILHSTIATFRMTGKKDASYAPQGQSLQNQKDCPSRLAKIRNVYDAVIGFGQPRRLKPATPRDSLSAKTQNLAYLRNTFLPRYPEESRNCAGHNGILRSAIATFRITDIIKVPLSRGGRGCVAFWINKTKRQKLTASILTFVMLFQIIAGIFAPINIFNLNQPNVANATWFNEGGTWQYRKSITVDSDKVANTNQAYFPMLVSMTDVSLKSVVNRGKVNSESGFDIAFTAENGSTKLDHEIETYTPTTGELKAWVKIPILSASEDTIIYIYYGNDAITETEENKTGVWDDGGANNFKMVQHMDQNPSGEAPQMLDSTRYGNNGTSGGTMTSDDLVTGQIDGAIEFDGGNDYADCGNNDSLDITDKITIGAWVKFDSLTGIRTIVSTYDSGGYGLSYNESTYPDKITFGAYIDGAGYKNALSDSIPVTDRWYNLAGVYDSNTVKLYIDGILQTSTVDIIGNIKTSGQPLQISSNPPLSNVFSGSIDEVRISNTARSADWIATEYNNQ